MLKDISFNIKKSKRKTLSIYIERDGTVTVIAPGNSTDKEIEEVIKKKEYQIYKSLSEWELTNSTKIEREFVNGQSFLYLGRNYRLEIVKEEQKKPLILKNGYFLLRKKDESKAKKLFIEFYKEKGLPIIVERVERYQKRINVNPKQIRIMELKNRWASCSEKGNLNFHWKCIMAPLDVLNYIVVHELAHLVSKNHTKAFWNEIDKVMPDFQKYIEWLRINGAAMDV
ncbi:MAG: M48 family metallopeptidase [Deltaproteobacteria bacterium]|nr:M48 family metallopeptidase [Deltaproteobacteria bacterium]